MARHQLGKELDDGWLTAQAGKEDIDSNHWIDAKSVELWLGQNAPAAVAVGNGTGGREAEVFLRKALRDHEPDSLPAF